ncbi:TMEM175 family protein [Paenibacillus sp. OV219]|uniref:TMEM175 family protein n=1 Tax=Paenibacillus sp. OV219 TaxID=1884377 RepID=UPI000B854907|nr:TMEM175 family protein [Paenibacillus sp. OV219]
MKANRMEAFSDGVLAIIITIMVLEFKVPEDHDWGALVELGPKILSYIFSFVYVGIYWNNHHHLVHMVRTMSGRLMWLNLLLLFWLSLVPFTTAWMGESHFASTPTALYGIILMLAALSYWLLQRAIMKQHASDSQFVMALGKDLKGKLSPVLYLIAILTAYVSAWISCFFFVLVAVIWFVPDKRIEQALKGHAINNKAQ